MTLREAAEILGVHYMTVYRYVRQGRLLATRQGTQWRVRSADLKAFQRAQVGRRRGTTRTNVDCEAMERRMLAGDTQGAWWVVESHLGGGLDPSGVLTELIVPALESIGDRWAIGDVSVAEEHRATTVAQRVVGRLGLQFGKRGKDRGTVALAAPSGDFHTLPVAIVADLLRWRGFNVLELGGDTPADAIGEAAGGQQRLIAVGIVSTTRGLDAAVASSVAAVRAAVPEVPIFIGGGSIRSAAHVRRLGGDAWTGQSADQVLEVVRRIAASTGGGRGRNVA
jgi:excisionase family DNA binding protein